MIFSDTFNLDINREPIYLRVNIKCMKRFLGYVKRPIIWVPILLTVSVALWAFSGESDLDIDIEEVMKRNVTEEISGTARVAADEEIALSFEVSGTVREVLVDEGDEVTSGDLLVRLNTELRQSEVNNASANLRLARARLREMEAGLTAEDLNAAEFRVRSALTNLESAREALEDVKESEDLRVRNAKELLLTTDINARLASDERSNVFSYEPPRISGVFTGSEIGEYRVSLYRSQADSGYSFRYETDLESSGTGRVSTITPQPIGSKGLYILFPSNFARGWDLEWLIEIPNTDSPEYPRLKQSYDSAKETRERTVRDAERRVREAEIAYESAQSDFRAATAGSRSEKIEAQEAVVEQAEIALEAAETNLRKSMLRAPISGTINTKSISTGETVSPGVPILSLVATGVPHLNIYVPEVDVANLSVGDIASVSLDAFPRETFKAEVKNISTIATDRDGVAAFKTRLDLIDPDERMRVGMTADVDIVTSQRSDVIAVPGRALVQRDGATFVRMIEGDLLIYRRVERGLRGSDGWVEIVSGLEEGERIVTYADESDLASFQTKME